MVRVLHCDDSSAYRALIAAALEADEDIELVAQASDLDSAVRAAREARPDVVLLDLVDVDRDALEELQAVSPAAAVVVLSGHPTQYGEVRRSGAAAYLQKGGPLVELRATVLRVAGG